MMDKPKFLYLVQDACKSGLHIWAASSDQAKRIYCKYDGVSPSDYWCGVRSLTARRLKPEEVREWEAQAEADRDTLIFIHGMLEIGAKAYAERGGGNEPL